MKMLSIIKDHKRYSGRKYIIFFKNASKMCLEKFLSCRFAMFVSYNFISLYFLSSYVPLCITASSISCTLHHTRQVVDARINQTLEII